MPDTAYRQLVEGIHASGRPLVVSVTGGGSRAIAELLSVAGASASVLEAVVPYSAAALEDWLGGQFDHACSERTARAMAMAAWERARGLTAADPRTLCGVGATASLATTRTKRGPHRVHVAWQSAQATVARSCELVQGARTRDEEEAVAAALVLQAVAEACGVATSMPPIPSLAEPITRREKVAPPQWSDLLLERRTCVTILPGEPASAGGDSPRGASIDESPPRIIFPGAFNPFHAAHRRMIEVAARRCGGPVTLELSINNVDKPTLDFLEIDDRLRDLDAHPVLLTRAATFVEKANLFPAAVFVVGADTIGRIGDRRYYDGIASRDAAIAGIAGHGCRFLVFGRVVDDRFCTLSNVEDLPAALGDLCDEVTADEFRDDVSSSELRRQV